MRAAEDDGGFVLIDALLAAGLLALGGTVVLAIAMSLLDRQRAELDRSVALVNMQSLAKQYLLVEPQNRSRLESADELFTYSFTRAESPVQGTEQLALWKIVATPRNRAEPIELTFLGPAGPP